MGLLDYSDDGREPLKLMTLEYSIEEEGHFLEEPIIELFCRDADGNRRYIEVEGYYPHFYITEDEFRQKKDDILSDTMVREVEVRKHIISEATKMNSVVTSVDEAPRETLDDRNLVRIYTIKPSQVSKMREFFDEHWEADVFFTNRFLVDSDIRMHLSIPEGVERVDYGDIRALDEGPDVEPRMVTVDIEVWSGGAFPDTQNPRKPVTAITAHDNYTDEYLAMILHPDGVDQGDGNEWEMLPLDWQLPDGVDWADVGGIDVYRNEGEMLEAFNQWTIEKDPDLLTGWNSSRNDIGSGFDYPYLINRCERLNIWSVRDLSYDNGRTFVTNRGSPVIGGTEMFDMLQAYKKTQIHEKRSYALDYISQEELGYGKEDVADLDEGWLYEADEFMQYNIRDTQAVHEIEGAKNVLEMYDHIRSITGATYSEIADSNIGIIDMLFLREAKKKGYALPTSERPSVQHYWGAYVFPPEPGLHSNVVYPDLSSLYPNLFRDMNASPETVIGFKDDLDTSKYSEEDCFTVYVDTRSESVKKDADEPERTELYVLKPEVKESFVREIVQELIDMKYEYKKDEYADEAYEAVKRIVNSVYGVMGDSKSYGSGFRLFDWRIAEAITLAGRDVIKHTAETFADQVRSLGYPNAEIIAGDTDSCVCEIDEADGMEETLEVSFKAAEYVNATYSQFMEDRYGITDGNMSVEIESYAQTALFMNKKKRYAQWIRWDEGDEVDEVEKKGFELVRSDSAEITAEVQGHVIDLILREDDAKEELSEYLRGEWEKVVSGRVELSELGRPSAINNPLMDYGWSKKTVEKSDDTPLRAHSGETLDVGDDYVRYQTPQPHICGARYANTYIDGEDISEGAKPLMFYLDGVDPTSKYPEVYDYDDELSLNAPSSLPDLNQPGMHEIGRQVHAIAVEDLRNLPAELSVDFDKMADKTIRDPVEPIVDVIGWSFDDLAAEGQQTGLSNFM